MTSPAERAATRALMILNRTLAKLTLMLPTPALCGDHPFPNSKITCTRHAGHRGDHLYVDPTRPGLTRWTR